MSDDDQTLIPASFVELFMPPGARRPNATRAAMAERYELCEDMAQMLTETARAKQFELGVTEADVLARMQSGLQAAGSTFAPAEARWVVARLAELLQWPMPPAYSAGP